MRCCTEGISWGLRAGSLSDGIATATASDCEGFHGGADGKSGTGKGTYEPVSDDEAEEEAGDGRDRRRSYSGDDGSKRLSKRMTCNGLAVRTSSIVTPAAIYLCSCAVLRSQLK